MKATVIMITNVHFTSGMPLEINVNIPLIQLEILTLAENHISLHLNSEYFIMVKS